MSVRPEVRVIETEIDSWVSNRRWWLAPRDLLLQKILEYYSDCLDYCFAKMTHDFIVDGRTPLGAIDDRIRAGVWQSLKWAMEFCHEHGRGNAKLNAKAMKRLNELGQFYETGLISLKLQSMTSVRSKWTPNVARS